MSGREDSDSPTIIFVEDDSALRDATTQALELAGFSVAACSRAAEALAIIESGFPGIVISDIRMAGMDGLQLMAAIRRIDPGLPVVLTTGHGDVDMAVAAMKDGAQDFLTKPYATDHLVSVASRALERRALELENERLQAQVRLGGGGPGPALVGNSARIVQLRRTLEQIAASDVDVLIEGETGTGKGLAAELLHESGARAQRRFVTADCAAMAGSSDGHDLFGRTTPPMSGAIERSSGGTLFLDEVDAMPEPLQLRMLRVLEDRRVRPNDAATSVPVNLRVIAASRHDLGELARTGRFLEPLFHRLNGLRVRMPALRDLREDIPLIFRRFVTEAEREMNRTGPDMDGGTWQHLLGHDWPGNGRELKRFAAGFVIGLGPASGTSGATEGQKEEGLKQRVARYEALIISEMLRDVRGDAAEAVRRLGIPRKTFYDKLHRHGIDIAAFRKLEPDGIS